MKQINECLDRFFKKQKPLKKKWKAFETKDDEGNAYLLLYHYHHLVLAYNLTKEEVAYEWYEKPADKRGLESAKKYLKERKNIILGV